MSNANRIHLLSLAAGTLNHIVNVDHYERARPALDAVLRDIEALTQTSIIAAGKVAPEQPADVQEPSPYVSEETRASAGPEPELGNVGTSCGCGDPVCALIDVLLGNRTDFTVESLVADFEKEFSRPDVCRIVLDANERIKQGIEAGEITGSFVLAQNLLKLAQAGKDFEEKQKTNSAEPRVEFRRVESFDELLGLLKQLGDKGETRH